MKLLIALLVVSAQLASALWPLPESYTNGTTVLWLKRDVRITYTGPDQSASPPSYGNNQGWQSSPQIVRFAIQRTYQTIFSEGYVPWKFNPRNSNFEPSVEGQTFINSVTLKQTAPDPPNVLKPLAGEVDESYKLSLTESGEATITAATSIGISRGLTTFTQLFYKHTKGGVYTKLAPVEIKDAPKFAHRGLNMDVSRNYFQLADIRRMIDNLAYSKFNRLHLHVIDSQSWPLEVPALPDLAAKGAYGSSMTYSPNDIEQLQNYAALQGVQMYLEIDLPGHVASIHWSQPELIAAYDKQPDWNIYSNEPPSGSIKLNSSKTYDFLGTLWDDLLPRMTTYSAYFHTGGDEVNIQTYNFDDTVNTNDTAILQPLMQKLIDFNHDAVRARGLVPIVWEEMLLVWNLTLGEDVIVQTWQTSTNVAATVASGHKALAGDYNFWYLDCGQGQWLDFYPGASSTQYYPYNDYCYPRHNWRVMYAYDPLEGVPEDQQHLVLGGEVHIWAEQTDPANIDRMVWPRACAAAEVLWSGAKDSEGQNRSQIVASPRLSDMRERLVARGTMAEPIQMPFCLMEGEKCAL
ncbi:glycoside hydrolase family 20 protein [Aulographum hederae CBS 113979]|uniref:Beta-hexosaminidase n=1 Tax=Aulographum hederae CBS 113979 TaxID=1176131 RepID=A0A6G1GYJ4_9PEZI|nr:glycoside hydrolase family 20 protein [Aulographum hederae CBS 113979]